LMETLDEMAGRVRLSDIPLTTEASQGISELTSWMFPQICSTGT
jgi:hypothetical protein